MEPTRVTWQPIATAPKDGTPVLVWSPQWRHPMFVHWIDHHRAGCACWEDLYEQDQWIHLNSKTTFESSALWDKEFSQWPDDSFGDDMPMHWLPIPTPPSADGS